MVVKKKLKQLQLYVHFGTLILNPYRHTTYVDLAVYCICILYLYLQGGYIVVGLLVLTHQPTFFCRHPVNILALIYKYL